MRILFAVAAVLVAAWLAVCAVLFIWPEDDEPERADAIVVLAGGKKQRLGKALELVDERVSRTLLISDGRDPRWPEANRLCNGRRRGLDVICFRPDPYSTHGEAEEVAELARRRGWRRIAVVTSTSHVFRARLLFDRCFAGDIDAVGAGHRLLYLPRALFWESAKLAWALAVDRRC